MITTLRKIFVAALVKSYHTDECIPWPFKLDNKGYGYILVGGKIIGAHRYVLQEFTGEKGDGEDACHKPFQCSSKACVNPRHLYWGTRADNVRDSVVEGTHTRGVLNGNSKFTEDDIRMIRKSSEHPVELGLKMGVNEKTIRRIRGRETYTNVLD